MVTVSSKGRITIPKAIRNALNLSEGAMLTIELSGPKIILSKEPSWRKLEGAAAGPDLIKAYAGHKKREREFEMRP